MRMLSLFATSAMQQKKPGSTFFNVVQWYNLPDILVTWVPTNEVGDEDRDAVEQQSRVKWNNFMKGRVVTSWSEAQNVYADAMPQNNKNKTPHKDLLLSKLITVLWSMFCILWNARNAHLHMEFDQIDASFINEHTRKAFVLKHSMFQLDHLLFYKPLQECFNSSHESKVHWINSVKIAVHDFKAPTDEQPWDITHDLEQADLDRGFIPNR
eukprot:15323785-Ditylum_brightwellii.AAC.1